ncbi:thiamine-phosphate pyrophosphorylase [Rhizomicrobium palustre]|uniref:Thiamine-phosphate pyrophosphorylase n=1 Tax=Rhizomicrobium palustre TaxID=189966 RepID=A0A846MYJ0_9PROT|nr:thiamine phosphate synthase [Rhizomicrobium palustre]NIK88102.1 thiamine-phosphate pyrophosphorylase [Rhizomicrobium palustre]
MRLSAHRALGIPPLILLTDDTRLPDPVAAATALPKGAMVIVRAKEAGRREMLALALREIARRRGLFLLIAGDAALARKIGADGVHLPQARIGEAAGLKARWPEVIVTASAHDFGAGIRAGAVDALLLSAVFPTQSHPGRGVLGAARANLMAAQMPLPVYALGGVSAENADLLYGFSGIAAIGALSNS